MALIINHNIVSMNAARNLGVAYEKLSASVRKLSSGLRINQAADDAAGLAVRELMRTEIAALNQGTRNANDAISLLQTFDGALSVIDEKLIRIKELAEQAATGTYTSSQRLIIMSEAAEMAREITRIANATDFNGIHLIQGGTNLTSTPGSSGIVTGGLKIHFGPGNASTEDYYYIRGQDMTWSGLMSAIGASGGMDTIHMMSTQSGAQSLLVLLDSAVSKKADYRAYLGAMQNRLANTVSNLQIQAENLQAAESRISDVDVATEMAEFVREQIRTQAAVAMLAQANTLPQLALTLLR